MTPNLAEVARSVLKSVIVGLATAGFITDCDAQALIRLLALRDA